MLVVLVHWCWWLWRPLRDPPVLVLTRDPAQRLPPPALTIRAQPEQLMFPIFETLPPSSGAEASGEPRAKRLKNGEMATTTTAEEMMDVATSHPVATATIATSITITTATTLQELAEASLAMAVAKNNSVFTNRTIRLVNNFGIPLAMQSITLPDSHFGVSTGCGGAVEPRVGVRASVCDCV